MKKEQVVLELYESVKENGLIETIHAVFGKGIKVSIAFSRSACDTEIDFLDFSVRAMNSLKRAGLFTVGEVVDAIISEELSKIRNLGRKTDNEIRTRILAFGYEKLTENEKKAFLYDMLERNCVGQKYSTRLRNLVLFYAKVVI